MKYKKMLEYAQELGKQDTLAYLRNQFHIPKDINGKDWLCFTGNSLGL